MVDETLKTQILEAVRARQLITFPALERQIEGFAGNTTAFFSNTESLVIWNFSDAAYDAFAELLGERKFGLLPATFEQCGLEMSDMTIPVSTAANFGQESKENPMFLPTVIVVVL